VHNVSKQSEVSAVAHWAELVRYGWTTYRGEFSQYVWNSKEL